MSFIICKDDDDPSKWSPSKKVCELTSLFKDKRMKSYEAIVRPRFAEKIAKEELGDLPYSDVEAFKNDQIAKASKLQEEIKAIKKKEDEILKTMQIQNEK